MKSRSLVSRLALLQQLLSLGIILIFAVSAVWLTRVTLERQDRAALSRAGAQIAEAIEREWKEEGDYPGAARATMEEVLPPGVQVVFHDSTGAVVASSLRPASAAHVKQRRQIRVPLPGGRYAFVSMSTHHRHDAIQALVAALLAAALPLLLIVTLTSRAVARRALRPLTVMATQADRASTSGTVMPLGTTGDPVEVARLASSFNRLLNRLDETLVAERHFSQDAAHELLTPLTVISGEIELALARPGLPPDQARGLEQALEQARDMSELVEVLLLLRRAEQASSARPEMQPMRLDELAADLVEEFAQQAPQRAGDIQMDVADSDAVVTGNVTLLRAGIRNLLTNAEKFSEPGEAIRVRVARSAAAAVITVEDAGHGIAPEDRVRVFDPFFRAAEARATHKGFGLGLPILKRIALAHGGSVEASESSLGGARFELRLPLRTP